MIETHTRVGFFYVRLIRKGDAHGMNGRLIYDGDEPIVEFYDTRYGELPRGQLAGGYYASMFMEVGGGIQMWGGSEDWRLSATQVQQVQRWLREEY